MATLPLSTLDVQQRLDAALNALDRANDLEAIRDVLRTVITTLVGYHQEDEAPED